MRATTLALLCASSVISVAGAQVPRSPVQVDTTTPAGFASMGPAVATDGDLSVAVFNDDVNNRVWAVVSDGRGVDWSAPIQVDADAIGGLKESGENNRSQNLAVVGDHVYVNWIDERNGGATERDVYFGRSTDGGQTWQEQRLDKGSAIGAGVPVDERVMAVSADPAGDHIYVLMLVTNLSGNDELFLVASHDGGVTFGSAVPVSTADPTLTDVDGYNIASQGFLVHLSWTDDRAGSASADDVFYRRSGTGGLTFDPEIQLDSSGPLLGDASLAPVVAAVGSTVAVIWEEELASATNEECRVAVSTNGGTSFAADQKVGSYTASDDIDAPNIVVCGGNIVAAWDDNRLGSDAVFVSYSSDNGATWQPDVQVSSTGGTGFAKLTADESGIVSLAAESTGSPNVFESSWSRDCGATWQSTFEVSDNSGDVDRIRIAYNALYDNVIAVWQADDAGLNNQFAGGYRIPTLEFSPTVIAPNVQLSFSLDHFEPNQANRFFFVLLSGAPGSLPLAPIDDRDLGLQLDGLLLTSLMVPGLFFGPLDALGQGSTPSFGLALPSGTSLFAAAVSFSVNAGVTTVHQITDVRDLSIP